MRHSSLSFAALAATTANAATNSTTLAEFCTVANVQAALPANGTFSGIEILPSLVLVNTVSNASSSAMGSSTTTGSLTYCNVTVYYTHAGSGDSVFLGYALPAPADFENRFYGGGGEGYSLNSDATGGLEYGAVGGITSAGYDNADFAYDYAVLLANGTINWDATYMFGYQALGEMTIIGKALTKAIYGLSSDTKLYTYFEGCSDGGREGMSQVQRWGEKYDGVIAGAPAFRYGQQQTNHMFSSVVEQTLDYYPPPCELAKIVNATIAACDPLDGKTDGVVSRTDLCMLNFNLTSIIGESYYCAAENSTSLGFGFGKRAAGSSTDYRPSQNGSVSAEGVAVAQAIYDGLHNSDGERAYLSWQIAAEFTDAETQYDSTTDSWVLDIPSIGGEYVAKFIKLKDIDNLSDINNVTYDTLVGWMTIGMVKYYDSLQTTLPDLTPFQSSGGKLLHYHGESDSSVPTASSVHYWQSVRSIMYPDMTDDESLAALKEWYQLYLVPGAAHCSTNTLQPDGPYPKDNMKILINWVENNVQPTALNATIQGGSAEGEVVELCQWPTRPLWQSENSTTFDCVNDTASIDTWTYTFPAFKLPVY